MVELLSQRAYAATRKKRGLTGGSHTAVRKAIEAGRLLRAVKEDERGRKWIDPDLADAEWEGATDPTQQRDPAVASGGSAAVRDQPRLFDRQPGEPEQGEEPEEGLSDQARIREARTTQIYWDSRRARLRCLADEGQLVNRRKIEQEAAVCAQRLRESMLGAMAIAAPMVAPITDPREVLEVLEDQARKALEALGSELAASGS